MAYFASCGIKKWRVCGAFPWRHVGETQGVKTLNQHCPLWKVSLVISGVGNFLSFKVPGEREEVQKGWLQLFFFVGICDDNLVDKA